MFLKRLNSILVFCFVVNVLTAQKTNDIKLLTQKKEFISGSAIQLSFKNTSKEQIKLIVKNSYGTRILNASQKENTINFIIPEYISKVRGNLFWKIISKSNQLSGSIRILPSEKPKTIETYLGPPSIIAGGKDFTMLVTIPTDKFDNPLKEKTTINIKTQFLENESISEEKTNNIIAYKNIFSPIKSGRMIISSESHQLNSTEFDAAIMPDNAVNYDIFYSQNHNYADGNQITSFYTSTIRDNHQNIISDGTYVYFIVQNKNNKILKTSGTTINGVATAKIIHPDKEENWQISSYIQGIAESNNTLNLTFNKAVLDYNYELLDHNRTITVGPIKSFQNQMIPDGLEVSLILLKEGKEIYKTLKTSRKGFVSFKIDKNIYPDGIYNIRIKSAGITKELQKIKLW